MKKVRKSIVYQRCEDLAGILVNLRYSSITQQDLEFMIKRHIGADKRTVEAYKDHLIEFNFLQLTKEGYMILNEFIPVQKHLEAIAENSK
jgi:hypothetical protein